MNTTRLSRTTGFHGWRYLSSRLIPAAFALLSAVPGHAQLVQVTMTAVADNTFVGSGDPCGTGLSGGNACNGQNLTINIVIDTTAAPADQDDAANRGFYRVITSPGFVTANLTLNGHLFSLPADASISFDQSVEMVDNLDGGGFGILDKVQFGVSGNNVTDTFSVSPTVQMTSGAFTGDALVTLGTIVGSPLAISGGLSLSNGTFNVSNATGQVSGQYRPSAVSFINPADLTPDPFFFLDQTGVALSAAITSAPVTITGIGGLASVSVAGGQYSVGCGGVFTGAPGTISNGQTVCVKQTSAATNSAATNTTLTIGGVADTFTSTTVSGLADSTPDPFTFTDVAGVPVGTVQTSNAVTIAGLDTSAPISVTGGTYSIGCGVAFTSVASTISNGQTVCVQQTSAATNSTSTNTTLTIGGVADTFTSTSVAAIGGGGGGGGGALDGVSVLALGLLGWLRRKATV